MANVLHMRKITIYDRYSRSYIYRYATISCATACAMQIPPAKHVARACVITCPLRKQDLARADEINRGNICPEMSRT